MALLAGLVPVVVVVWLLMLREWDLSSVPGTGVSRTCCCEDVETCGWYVVFCWNNRDRFRERQTDRETGK